MGMTSLCHVAVDLLKGAFELTRHFQCYGVDDIQSDASNLVCYDIGIPWAAWQACDDPMALIFPLQENEATGCGSCGSIFQKQLFSKISNCPFGKTASIGTENVALEQNLDRGSNRMSAELTAPPLFSLLSSFSLVFFQKQGRIRFWNRDNNAVIVMGSLALMVSWETFKVRNNCCLLLSGSSLLIFQVISLHFRFLCILVYFCCCVFFSRWSLLCGSSANSSPFPTQHLWCGDRAGAADLNVAGL